MRSKALKGTIAIAIGLVVFGACDSKKYNVIDGRVVDGEIKGATVFYDINRNGIRDKNEPFTKSDEKGYFHLRVQESLAKDYSIPIVTEGGYDIRAKEEYTNTLMSFREKNKTNVIVTPLSTLIAADIIDKLESQKSTKGITKRVNAELGVSVEELFTLLANAQESFAELFELDIKLLTQDPIELAKEGNLELLKTNMKVNKVANQLKRAIKKDVRAKQKAALTSFRALSKALREAQREARKGDDVLAQAVEYIAQVAPEAFDPNVITIVKESTKAVLEAFEENWEKSKEEIITALKEEKEFPKEVVKVEEEVNITKELESNITKEELNETKDSLADTLESNSSKTKEDINTTRADTVKEGKEKTKELNNTKSNIEKNSTKIKDNLADTIESNSSKTKENNASTIRDDINQTKKNENNITKNSDELLTLQLICENFKKAFENNPEYDDSSFEDIYPEENIKWEAGDSSVEDIATAFNQAHELDPTAKIDIIMPSQEKWNAMSANEQMLYLLNQERIARGIKPFEGYDEAVSSVAQNYANLLYEKGKFGHTEDGTPWERLDRNNKIKDAHDFFKYAENLYAAAGSNSYTKEPIAKAVYNWIYADKGSSWGHRKLCLANGLKENSGVKEFEGIIGVGVKKGEEYKVYDGYKSTIVVLNVIDQNDKWIFDTNSTTKLCKEINASNIKEEVKKEQNNTEINTTLPKDTTPPTITLKGDNPQVVEFGKAYEELGAKARDDVDGDVNVTIVADVETKKLGEYEVIYKAKDSAGNEANATRVVKVVDTTPPTITLFGEENTTLELGESYKEAGFEAIDNVDGNITNKVEVIGTIDSNTTGSYTLTYKVVDSSGNEANATRVVNVITPKDTTAPKIILNGEKELSLILGNPYKELGAKAVDDVDGDINVTIISNVNDTKLGEYQVIYLAKDSAGNEANATRVVKIISPEVLVSHLSFIEKKCGHFESIPLEGSYVLNNNDWGRNKLTNNEDGIQCVFTLEDEQGIKGGWFWGWPNGDEGGVKGYPEAIYGKKFSHQVNLEGILPQKVKDLDQVNIDVEYEDFNITGRYNIALESWLHTTNDSSMDDIRYEVMVRFDPDGFHPGKRLLFAENVDIDGITYTVYKKQEPDNPNRYFYNFVAQKKVTKISFDFKKFLDYLKENDPETCSDMDELYYNDIEMGVETVNGSGVLILDKFNVNVILKNQPLSLSGTPQQSELALYDEFEFTPEVNGTNVSFEAKNLPQGLEVNSTTGTISGIVTQAGEFNDITLIAKSGESNATLSFDLKVLSQKEQLAEPLAQAIANSDEEKIVEYESEIVFEDSINRFKEYYGALPTNTIKVFKDNPKLKKALASITTDGELEVFVLQNFEDMLREFKDKANIENYYNILFGYAVEAGSSGIYNEQVFWDGWGDHIGHYGAHEIWSKEDEALFKKAEESIRENGTIVGIPDEKFDNFSIYLSEKYKLTTLERYLIRKWNGYYYNHYLADALSNNVDLVNTSLKELIDNHKLQLPLINTYLKIKGLEPRPLSDLKELIDNYMTQKGYSTYKEYFVNFDANKEEILEDHIGSRYDVWFLKPYLRKVVDLDKQARVDAMPALTLAKRVIELYESKDESDYWPILKDQITQRPWQLYALDEGSEAKGCEWVQKRFFEDDPQVRSDMIKELGTKINLKEDKYTERLITYATYNSPWTDPDIWYQGSNYHPEFSVPVIVRQGGICGHQGTLEQHSKSCLGVPTLGRAEPIHRCLVEVTLDSNTQNYKAVIRQGVFEKGYRGTLLQAPFRTNFDKEVREWGGERVDGLVNALTPSSDGFGSNLTKAMILQRLAAKDSNNSESLLKEAIALYPSNPTSWYQLALTYAQNNQEQKVIDLANEYLSKLDDIPLESQNQDLMTKDYEKLTAWGIVSSLVAKQTPNAIDLSLEFIENNFQSGFLLEGYKEMFVMLKEQNATNWKEQSQKVFETMLKYNSLNRFPNYGFWGVASWYWDEDTDFINQMKDLVINSTTASDEFKRNILKIIFQEDNIYIKQVKFAEQDAVLVKTIAISDADSQNLFITTNSFPNEVLPEDKGKEGYKILDVNVTNENGELYTLKMRVAKEYNNTLIAPNDSTGPVEGDTKFLFWIDAKDNENLPTGTYSTVEAVKIMHKGYRENTYYDIGESILIISDLKIFPEFETTTLEMNTTHIDFNVGDTSDTTYNFYNNPNFIDDTIGVEGKTSFNITVVDTNDNEYSLPVDMYQMLANVSGKPIYKADSAGPWKGGGYDYRFNIDINTSKISSDLNGTIVSTKEPLIIYKRAWHLDHKIVEKIIFTIKNFKIELP